tara:strand:- start:409 stop:1200 length:792 start_codon:yes stop_codon:yes gene_type:complete
MAGFNNSRFLKSKGVVAVCYLLGLFVFPVMNLQAELHEVDQLRTHVEKWVETKQLISSESSQWKMDKILLKDTIRLLELDNEELDEIINDSELNSTVSAVKRAELETKQIDFKQLNTVLGDEIQQFEKQLFTVWQTLPISLKERLKNLAENWGDESEHQKKNSKRVLNVTRFMKEVELYNASVNLEKEILEIKGEPAREYQVIYQGLSVAYFVNDDGAFSGYGFPKDGAWHWVFRKDISPKVTNLIAMHEGKKRAAFIDLPVR